MALPLTEPRRRFHSQRIDGRPYVNCLPYSICPILDYMGYDVPPTFGMDMRQASGVPMAEHRGTSYADMKRALKRLLPDAPVTFSAVTDAELLNLVARVKQPNRANVVSVVARMERLPRYLRRHAGYTWEGLHALTIHGRKRAPDESWHIYYSDPMGRTYRDYRGEWIPYADLEPGLKRNSAGLIHVIYGHRRTAV